MRQIFILSPAKTTGERAQLIYNPRARFDLARKLQAGKGIALAEIFSFLSGLYFRGKVTYAKTFCRAPKGVPGVLVVTSNRGLLPIELTVTLWELRAFSEVPVDPKDARYAEPLARGAELLAEVIGRKCRVVFLGSIGTERYTGPLLRCFGEQLAFPTDFVGRGDMSRGGLLLRAAAAREELSYAPVQGAVRHGERPSKLPPRRWGYKVTEGTTPLDGASLPRQL